VGELTASVIRVVRTATPEVDRRHTPRYNTELACRISIPGREAIAAHLADISEGGASLRTDAEAVSGSTGTLHVDGISTALPFSVNSSGNGLLRLSFRLDAATATALRPALERLAVRRAA
jgi:hypothetical protein